MKLLIASALVLAAGCPTYSDDIGVEGTPVDEGAMAGTFAMKGESVDQAESPLGKVDTGGRSFYLLKREYEGGDEYKETLEVCSVKNFETAGLSSVNNQDAIDAIEEMTVTVTVDHARGVIERETFRELWAVRDLDADDEFPQNKDSDKFYDSDDDGNPGATTFTSGLVNGEVYFAQRKEVTTDGVTAGPDESFGLLKAKKQSNILDADNPLLLTESQRVPHPDPKQSWWIELRIDDDEGCDKVNEMADDETLPRSPPFER